VYIDGGGPPKKLQSWSSDNIVITGFVDDVRPYVQRASVYIVPLRMGGGTRLKVLEALAMKKPVITTALGCEGINVTDGVSVAIADDPLHFAEVAVRLMRDNTFRHTLAENGHQLVRRHYEWSVVGRQLNTAYNEILSNSLRRSNAIHHNDKSNLVEVGST
jgi:glycosyltransferase involved in cell wall biosynthesis